jgi:hypothetical protein
MMTDLLEIKWAASNPTLQSFSQNWIEWFLSANAQIID